MTRLESDEVDLLLDTGADITLLPLAAARAIGVSPTAGNVCSLVGFDGTASQAPVVELALRFLGKTIGGRFVLIDREVGILGRNVLNHFRLSFDGPGWGEID